MAERSSISTENTEATEVITRAVVHSSEVFPVSDENVGPQHFKKLKLLGRGGVGRVYLVILKGTDKLYAMKELTKEEMLARNKVTRVMTEREILASANHPFVMTMYASFQTKTKLFFVMDYCAGGEFYRFMQIQPNKRFSEDAARFYAAEIILALEYLHQMGFIYRDLKPENVLLRESGHIALTDFDLSKQGQAISPQVKEAKQSMLGKFAGKFSKQKKDIALLDIVSSEPVLVQESNSFVGTEEYIAPEVVNGVAQTASVDWWTLGILIYEMIVGHTPFKGKQQNETFTNILNKDVFFPEDIDMSTDCKSCIKKLLIRDPKQRLGGTHGASDIKKHKWFKDINFALIRNEIPPVKPNIRDPQDMSQYKDFKDDLEGEVLYKAEEGDLTDQFGQFNVRRDEEASKNKY